MKFQQIVLTGLFALTATATVQSAAFSAQPSNPTQLTSDDVAAFGINTPRSTNASTPIMTPAQFQNPTHPRLSEIGAGSVQQQMGQKMPAARSFLNITQLTSDDVAAFGINPPLNSQQVNGSSRVDAQSQYPPRPIVDEVVMKGRMSHADQTPSPVRQFRNPTHPTASEIGNPLH
jgi:hypothetical protein